MVQLGGGGIIALIFIIMKINICMKTGFLFFENYS